MLKTRIIGLGEAVAGDDGEGLLGELTHGPAHGDLGLAGVADADGLQQIVLDAEVAMAAADKGCPPAEEKPSDGLLFVKGGSFTMGCTSEQGSDCSEMEKPAHTIYTLNLVIGD